MRKYSYLFKGILCSITLFYTSLHSMPAPYHQPGFTPQTEPLFEDTLLVDSSPHSVELENTSFQQGDSSLPLLPDEENIHAADSNTTLATHTEGGITSFENESSFEEPFSYEEASLSEEAMLQNEADLTFNEPLEEIWTFEEFENDPTFQAMETEEIFFMGEEGMGEEIAHTPLYNPTVSVTITLPFIGPLVFTPAAEEQAALSAQSNQLALETQQQAQKQANEVIQLGIMQLTSIQAHVQQEGTLALEAAINLLGKKGTVTLESYTPEETKLLITLADPLSFTLHDGRIVELKNWHLLLGPHFQELYTRSAFFSDKEDGRLSLGLSRENPAAYIEADHEILLSTLVPEAKDHADLAKTLVHDVVINLPNPLFPLETAAIEITGSADMNHIVLYKEARLGIVDCLIVFSPEGITVEATGLTPLTFPDEITLQQPQMITTINPMDKTFELVISGILEIDVPGVGTIQQRLYGEKTDDGFRLEALLDKEISFHSVAIGSPLLLFLTEGEGQEKITKTVIQGTATILGYEVIPKLHIVRSQKLGKRIIEFSAKIKDDKPLAPFASIKEVEHIPQLKEIQIHDATIGFRSLDKTFFIGGTTTILGVTTKAELMGSNKGIAIKASTTKPWKVSDSIDEARGTVFDSITFNEVSFIASSYRYYDPTYNIKVNKGISVIARISSKSGVFANARKLLGDAIPEDVVASLTISSPLRKSKLLAVIPIEMKLSEKASLANCSLEVTGEPSVALLTTFKFKPSEKEQPLYFTGRIQFEPTDATLAGTMEGYWNNPLGISGFSIGDTALEVTLPYAIPPVPTSFGLTGRMLFGDIITRIAVKLGGEDIVLLGEVNKLYITDLIKAARQAGVNLGALNTLDLKFEDIKLTFAPEGGQIGEIIFDPGITVAGKMFLKIPDTIDTHFFTEVTIDPMFGIKASAQMPNLEVGPLKLKGAGIDGKYGTEDDGPVFKMALTPLQQRLFISCALELLGNTAHAEVDISPTSLKAMMKLKLFNFLDVDAELESYTKEGQVGVRLMGETTVGGASMKVIGDVNNKGALIAGNLRQLTLQGLAQIGNDMGASIPLTAIPNIGISDIELFVRT